MKWPSEEQISAMTLLPPGYRQEQLRRTGVPSLIGGIQEWHPEIAVGAASCYLREDFYTSKVFLAGETETDIIVYVIKQGDDLAAMWSLEQEPEALSVYGRLVVVAPEHGRTKIAFALLEIFESVGRSMGAEFLYGMATLKVPHMQRTLEGADYRLIGFVPGYDREMVAPGVVKRVYEAVYAKVLVPEEKLLRPDPENMTPATKALFDLLFPH